ncbi:MAG: hypothetical protein IPM79_06305 [Polyangiaceae bacterium]|jgi:hypothetical protein|nr:hypothetical protein [Polyangiaceae bacterium]MBK8937249.1 hypothetical protein [Polyangiaceae bacterium]
MSRDPRKTERMASGGGDAPRPRSTERMGVSRDTTQDPPRVYDTTGPEPEPAVGPRGTAVIGRPPKPAGYKPSDKAVAGEVLIGTAKAPRPVEGGKIDVSRVDPRRAPTQKSQRRPEAYLRDVKKKGLSPTVTGLIVVGALAVFALALLLLVLGQRGGP